MNIKDPEVRELARRLAERRRTTLTNAVREALGEALDRDLTMREGVAERLTAIAAEMRERGAPPLTDDDLYDEQGLPA